VGSQALFVVIPDPVTCFATARYSQKQIFRIQQDSNLVVVDWFTSGRYECGERWDFELYRSTNNILYEDDEPLLLDTVMIMFLKFSFCCRFENCLLAKWCAPPPA